MRKPNEGASEALEIAVRNVPTSLSYPGRFGLTFFNNFNSGPAFQVVGPLSDHQVPGLKTL
jgi:hypothetical protein